MHHVLAQPIHREVEAQRQLIQLLQTHLDRNAAAAAAAVARGVNVGGNVGGGGGGGGVGCDTNVNLSTRLVDFEQNILRVTE